jgi:Ca2+-transporting ATPase
VFQSVGLGYGEPTKGLMKRKPRSPDEPILTRSLLYWLGTAGAVIGLGTLGIIWWAADNRTDEVARTMGLTTFAIMNIFFSLEARDELRSIFNLDVLEDRKFMIFTGMSVAATVLGTELNIFQRIIKTVSLTFDQWLACIVVSFAIVVAAEVRKVLLRRRQDVESEPEPAAAAAA